MEITTPAARQALHYLNAIQNQGYAPTVSELDAYARNPIARSRSVGGALSGIRTVLSSYALTMQTVYGETTTETFVEMCNRLSWAVTGADERVTITPLGRAVVQALRQEATFEQSVLISTLIEPEDPFAYAKIIGTIADLDDVLVVDAYLKLDGLIHLMRLPQVARVLTSDETSPGQKKPSAKLATFEHVVGAAAAPAFQARSLGPKKLHDRYVIPQAGHVLTLSTSLNSIGDRIGTATWLDDIASAAVRKAHEALWVEATPVEPVASPPVPGAGEPASKDT